MSRFQAGNGWQNSGAPGPATPRQLPYDQTDTINLDSWGASEQSPPPADEVEGWVADQPAARFVDVQDLNAADEGEIVGGPGSSAVYPEGRQMYANYQGTFENDMDEKLYKVAENIHNVQVAISNGDDFSFSGVQSAANEASDHIKSASTDTNLQWVVSSIPSILNDIEDNLVATNDYRQASKDLSELKTLVEDTYKFASDDDDDEDDDSTKEASKVTTDESQTEPTEKTATKVSTQDQQSEKTEDGAVESFINRLATNGNQETLQITDVRDLDDSGSNFTYENTVTPDHVTNVLQPEEVNGEDAGYVPYMNWGQGTGIEQGVGVHPEVFPNDTTNPALVPYSAVQAARTKVFAALNLYDKLEALEMVNPEEKFVHIAKFEQMSEAELKGFSDSIDMFEKSASSRTRIKKVASTNSGRLPDMGRATTASVSKDSVLADDYLIGIK
jgi:hypothetical protein